MTIAAQPAHDRLGDHFTGDGSIVAIAEHYRSVDSAPARYSVDRPAGVVNGFLLTFAGATAITMCLQMLLVRGAAWSDRRDLLVLTAAHGTALAPTRLFVVVFFLTYACYAYGNLWRRVALAGSLLGKFAVVCVLVDLAAWSLGRAGLAEVPAISQQVISVLVALLIFPHTIVRHANLPQLAPGPFRPRTPSRAYVRLLLPLAIALIAAAVIERRFLPTVAELREWALLGGVGPGVFLAQQIFVAMTGALGWWLLYRSGRRSFTPDLAVLIPAHNEAHGITKTIFAVDRAAAHYSGQVRIYVVDNASTDATRDVAERAVAACVHLTGTVLHCEEPGKAIALNRGLRQIDEAFVVRVDADTIVGADAFTKALRHFADPDVAAVGGLPLPATTQTLIDKVRLVEVLMRHGFFQVSQFAYQGVLGVPGMLSVYRRQALDEVGGLCQGMNGEDVDICIRMNAAGYTTVSDPRVRYFSETPQTYAHLREQRVRWFRSIYHLASNNRAVLFDRDSIIGSIVLPFMLASAARRAMLAPILIYALFIVAVFRVNFSGLHWQPIVATVAGVPAMMAVLICLLWRRPDAVLYLPAYLGFRILRSYFTLAATLTLVFPPLPNPAGEIRRRIHPHGARSAPDGG